MAVKTVYALPQIVYQPLADYQESRPVALLTEKNVWEQFGARLNLPIVAQAEPDRTDDDFIQYLTENLPSVAKVLLVLGAGQTVTIGKLVAHKSGLPLVILPTQLDSDHLLEPTVETMKEGILTTFYTGAAERLVVDWEVIKAAPPAQRAGLLADLLAIITGLLDWRHAAKLNRTAPDQKFAPWAAGLAANLASQTVKIAEGVGAGDVEALTNLLELASLSVQLANQLGHARQQEGMEHYLAFNLQKHGVKASHAELLAPGILLTSALHGQDPSALRDALNKAGLRLDAVRPADLQVALNDLSAFVAANDLPFSIAHDLDPFSDSLASALKVAGLSLDSGPIAVNPSLAQAKQTTGNLGPTQPLPFGVPPQQGQ